MFRSRAPDFQVTKAVLVATMPVGVVQTQQLIVTTEQPVGEVVDISLEVEEGVEVVDVAAKMEEKEE